MGDGGAVVELPGLGRAEPRERVGTLGIEGPAVDQPGRAEAASTRCTRQRVEGSRGAAATQPGSGRSAPGTALASGARLRADAELASAARRTRVSRARPRRRFASRCEGRPACPRTWRSRRSPRPARPGRPGSASVRAVAGISPLSVAIWISFAAVELEVVGAEVRGVEDPQPVPGRADDVERGVDAVDEHVAAVDPVVGRRGEPSRRDRRAGFAGRTSGRRSSAGCRARRAAAAARRRARRR